VEQHVEVTIAARGAAVRVLRLSPERAPAQLCEALQDARRLAQRTDTGLDSGAELWRTELAWGCARLVVERLGPGAVRALDVLPAVGGDEAHLSCAFGKTA
jgi:hypothetical protein